MRTCNPGRLNREIGRVTLRHRPGRIWFADAPGIKSPRLGDLELIQGNSSFFGSQSNAVLGALQSEWAVAWREIGRLDLYRLGSWPRARGFFVTVISFGHSGRFRQYAVRRANSAHEFR